MSAIECGRGHLYDPNIYASCPYCNGSQQSVTFTGTPVGDAGKTMPLSSAAPTGGAPAPVPVINDGKTLPPKGYQAPRKVTDEDNKTTGMMKKTLGIDPVVGWLVCIKGPDIGKDFRIKGQINTIGRSEKMDICIKGDKTISNENHARLSYSEKNNRFNLIPADSKNIIYLNDDEVFTPAVLKPYDVIEFGETKLMFVPLCSESFDWARNKAGGESDAVEK